MPLNYTISGRAGMVSDFNFSRDGKWASALIGRWQREIDIFLYKRVFFHLDGRYQNGISMPILTEGYREYDNDLGVFVEHPVHGLCFAESEFHSIDEETYSYTHPDREGYYLYLFKMSDALKVIEKQMAALELIDLNPIQSLQ